MRKWNLGLVLLTIIVLSGCSAVETKPRVQAFEDLMVHYFRVGWSEETMPEYRLIENRQALDAYLATLPEEDYYNAAVHAFIDEALTEDFFEQSQWLVIYLEEGSGSNRHRLTSLEVIEGRLVIEIERDVPEIGTTDMAAWHMIIELDKAMEAFESVQVIVK